MNPNPLGHGRPDHHPEYQNLYPTGQLNAQVSGALCPVAAFDPISPMQLNATPSMMLNTSSVEATFDLSHRPPNFNNPYPHPQGPISHIMGTPTDCSHTQAHTKSPPTQTGLLGNAFYHSERDGGTRDLSHSSMPFECNGYDDPQASIMPLHPMGYGGMNHITSFSHRADGSYPYGATLASAFENGGYEPDRIVAGIPQDRNLSRVNGTMPMSHAAFQQLTEQPYGHQLHNRLGQQPQSYVQNQTYVSQMHHTHPMFQSQIQHPHQNHPLFNPPYIAEPIHSNEQLLKERESMSRENILRSNKISVSIIKKSTRTTDSGIGEKITTVHGSNSFYDDIQRINDHINKPPTKFHSSSTKKSRKKELHRGGVAHARSSGHFHPTTGPTLGSY